jgi:enterochelin esterase-like enzyme
MVMQRLLLGCLLASLLFTAGCALAPTPFPTPTPTDTPTASLTPSITPTASLTPTRRPTDTASPTLPPTATFTPLPTATPLPSNTPLPTATPTASATPTATPNPLACGATRGTIADDEVRSSVLGSDLHFHVYLPPCYDEAAGFRYPTLYMFHGLAANERQWDELGLNETLDRLIAAREIYPFIVIMPRDRGEANLGDAAIVDLLPYVDTNYRTLADRSHRAVGGLSRGGGWAVFLGLRNANQFSAIGGHSFAIQPQQAEQLIPILRALPERHFPRIFFDTGERDSLKSNNSDWLEARLTERGMPFEYDVNPGDHLASYWTSHLEQYVRFYAAAWP